MSPITAPNPPKPAGEFRDKVRSLRISREETQPWLSWSTLVPWVLLLCVGGYAGFLSYRLGPDGLRTALRLPQAAPQPVEAPSKTTASPTTAAPVPSVNEIALESRGFIVPAHQILVSPKVSGMIEVLRIEREGQFFRQGDVLALLESTDYQADVDRATAMLRASQQRLAELEKGFRDEEKQQARADLSEGQVLLEQYRLSYERAQSLRAKKSITDTEFEQAQSQFRSQEQRLIRLSRAYDLVMQGPREERIEAARADVKQNEADLRKAEWRLSNCRIVAPITGTILKKNAEQGNLVNPIAMNGSFSLCEMADLAALEVELFVQERDVSRVRERQKCAVRPEAYPQREYAGYVSRLMPIADRAKGALPVRVTIIIPTEERGRYLKPEMSAIVSFLNADLPEEASPPPGESGDASLPEARPSRPTPPAATAPAIPTSGASTSP